MNPRKGRDKTDWTFRCNLEKFLVHHYGTSYAHMPTVLEIERLMKALGYRKGRDKGGEG